MSRGRNRLTFHERQVAFGICCGMTHRQMARELGVSRRMISLRAASLLAKTGMADRMEFALTQNAAVRRLVYGD